MGFPSCLSHCHSPCRGQHCLWTPKVPLSSRALSLQHPDASWVLREPHNHAGPEVALSCVPSCATSDPGCPKDGCPVLTLQAEKQRLGEVW